MALQALANKMGMLLHSDNGLSATAMTQTTVDAAGESRTYIGKVYLEAGTGSKTISSAGGKIVWASGTAPTFSDAGTTLRIGIQNVNASGIETGTFDVYKDLIGGTDIIAAATTYVTAMANGTKTIAHGDLVAVSLELTTRGGADVVNLAALSVGLSSRSTSINFPYQTQDTGIGPAKGNLGVTGCCIEFDDGTLGWLAPGAFTPGIRDNSTITYNSGSTPDEYAVVFELPFKGRIAGGYLAAGVSFSTALFDLILYSNPLGTPTVVETLVVDANYYGDVFFTAPYYFQFATPRIFEANTKYAISLRPTTTANRTIGYVDMGTGNEKYKRPFPFGETLKLMARTDQTGAFVDTQTYYFPLFGLMIDQLDDGGPTLAAIAQATWEYLPRTLTS